jgi:proline iminopeptidase
MLTPSGLTGEGTREALDNDVMAQPAMAAAPALMQLTGDGNKGRNSGSRKRLLLLAVCLTCLPACGDRVESPETPTPSSYLDYTGRSDLLGGGARMIPIKTPKGEFRVWTKRVGNNPTIKVLLLHGGPGATHECFEALDSYFPGAGIEYYYYDQLGSAYSDQPNEPDPQIPASWTRSSRRARRWGSIATILPVRPWGGLLAISTPSPAGAPRGSSSPT